MTTPTKTAIMQAVAADDLRLARRLIDERVGVEAERAPIIMGLRGVAQELAVRDGHMCRIEMDRRGLGALLLESYSLGPCSLGASIDVDPAIVLFGRTRVVLAEP